MSAEVNTFLHQQFPLLYIDFMIVFSSLNIHMTHTCSNDVKGLYTMEQNNALKNLVDPITSNSPGVVRNGDSDNVSVSYLFLVFCVLYM